MTRTALTGVRDEGNRLGWASDSPLPGKNESMRPWRLLEGLRKIPREVWRQSWDRQRISRPFVALSVVAP
jgi:hypothetical protein